MGGNGLSSKEKVLNLLKHEEVDYIPCFSGMGNIVMDGLKKYGLHFNEVHQDAQKMAYAAKATPELFGYDCAIVPFDFNVAAEVLGSKVQYYTTEDILYPSIPEKIIKSFEDIKLPSDPENAGRFPIVMEAIRILKKEIGDKVAVGSWVLGPFTLAGQVTDLNKLLKDTFKKPNEVVQFLTPLRDLLIAEAKLYQKAGADFITVREMGTPVDLLSPRVWKSMIQPFMIKMREEIGSPVVLHICGKTNEIIHFMHECGYDAVSVEHQNDVAMSRQKIGPPPKNLLFGNLNTFKVMVQGSPEDVAQEVKAAIDGGVDAIWPGCDIWPGTPAENMKAMVETTREYGSKKKKGG